MAQLIKNLSANAGDVRDTQVQSLGQEDPLEKEVASCFSILGQEISMDRRAWWATVHGVAKSWTWMSMCPPSHTHTHTHTHTQHIFIHSSLYGHLRCFHVLAIVNNDAVSIEKHISFQISVFIFFWKNTSKVQSYYPMTVLRFSFWRTSILFSIVAVLIYNPTNSVGSVFFTSMWTLVICCLFDHSHSGQMSGSISLPF